MESRRIAALTLLAAVVALAGGQAQVGAQSSIDFSGGLPSYGGEPFGLSDDAAGDPVTLSARYGVAADGGGVLEVTAEIASGYHIYSTTQPAGGPAATVITVDGPDSVSVAGAFVADPTPLSHVDNEIWNGLTIEEHTDLVVWRAPLRFASGVAPGSSDVTGMVSLQACQAFSCLPLELSFTARFDPAMAPAPTAAEPAAEEKGTTDPPPPGVADGGGNGPKLSNVAAPMGGSLVTILGAAFLGGLILNLMPCVLPVIGLKVLSFAEQAGHDRGRVLAMNLAYSVGLIAVFMVLAALAAFAGYGWGELFTHTEFKIGMVILVFAMALSFLGVWEIPIPGFAGAGKANKLQASEGLSGAFFKGVFTTILATPCSGPFLGTVIGFTLTQPPWMTFTIFGAVGLGMASPYLLIGVFPDLVRWLPKPGMWMETFKQLMGFVLMGTVVFLMWAVAESHYLPLLTTLVAVGFACWWIGTTPLTASSERRAFSWIGGVGTAIATGWLAFTMTAPDGHDLPWKPYSEQALAAALDRGETVLVDFTADWCLTCKLNLETAIDTEDVKRVVEANRVTPLLADWSDRNDDLKAKLASLGSRSIPLLAIYPTGRPDDPIILRDLITEEQLLDALREAGATAENAGELAMPTIEIGEVESLGSLR